MVIKSSYNIYNSKGFFFFFFFFHKIAYLLKTPPENWGCDEDGLKRLDFFFIVIPGNPQD